MGHFGTNPNEKEGNLITNSSFGFGESPLLGIARAWYHSREYR